MWYRLVFVVCCCVWLFVIVWFLLCWVLVFNGFCGWWSVWWGVWCGCWCLIWFGNFCWMWCCGLLWLLVLVVFVNFMLFVVVCLLGCGCVWVGFVLICLMLLMLCWVLCRMFVFCLIVWCNGYWLFLLVGWLLWWCYWILWDWLCLFCLCGLGGCWWCCWWCWWKFGCLCLIFLCLIVI